ncbi:AAA family ATPase [Nocardia huaxiensis]|uniref:AAA family ATPase n=1 Tax=Nocardia huaxiensis TaxID=2755382 RepID=A0A7D6VG98_9NOCA|nr:BTAD domain-containing putative transcriptional regulator [Nocardia huaxiensis]QLY31975.1 AAA family ATPase [Nocardia huaxiensis]
MVSIEVLGALRVRVNGDPAPLRGPMQGAVLARLVVAAGEVVSADRLIDDLWQGEPPPKATAALQAHISYLRRALEPDRPPRAPARVLVSRTPGYTLHLPVTAVDVWHFEHLLAQAAAESDPRTRHRDLGAALALWQGAAYTPYADAPWAAAESDRLTDLRWTALEHQAAAALDLGRPDEAATLLHRLADTHPEREEAVRLLALARYRQGRQLAALETLRKVRTHLNTEYGVDPSPPLRALESAILAHAPELDYTPPTARPYETVDSSGGAGTATPGPTDPAPGSVSSYVRGAVRNLSRESTSPAPLADEVGAGYVAERAGLLAAAGEARAGRSRVVWVEGEAGAGKTTLVSDVARLLQAEGWVVVTGHCPEVDGAPAAWAWIELCGELAGAGAAGAVGSRAAGLVASHGVARSEAASGVEGIETVGVSGVDATPFGLARAVADGCGERGVAGPVVVVLEDAHRADSATLQILRQVVAWSAGAPVLFVVTLRGSEAGEELRATSAALAAVTAGRWELGGLDVEAVRDVMVAVGLAGIDEATAVLVRDRTGGNPMFVRELAKLAAAEGDLLAVPAGVRDVLQRRIARLPAEAARLLRFIAVWGGEVGFDELVELAGESEETLVDLVDTAVVAGLLRLGHGGRIHFWHALTRDTVYDGIPALRRGRMHWAALGVAARSPQPELDALAHHAIAGATPATAEQALVHVTAAARHCVERRAHPDARALWSAALDLHLLAGHDRSTAERRHRLAVLETRCALVAGLAYSGNDTAARTQRQFALDLAETLAADMPPLVDAETGCAEPDPVAFALASWRAPLIWGTRDKRLTDTRIVEALGAALARPLPAATRVRLLVATVFEVEGDDDPLAFAASAEAIALSRTLDDPELLCAALNARAFLALGPDLWEEREPLTAELLTVSTESGLVEFQAVAHFMSCLIACGANDLVGARAAVERGLECASGGQLRQMLVVLSAYSAVLALLRGELAEAERIYTRCSAEMVASGTANGAELMVAAGMALNWARGDLSGLVEPMAAIHAEAADVMPYPYALSLLHAGEPERARKVFRAAGPLKRDHYWSVMTVFRARAAIHLGEPHAIADCYRDMLPRSGTMAGLDTGSVVYGPMDTILAELAQALGDFTAVADHRARAAEVERRIRLQLDELDG